MTKLDLDHQAALRWAMRVWRLAHLPATAVLLIVLAVHVVLVLGSGG